MNEILSKHAEEGITEAGVDVDIYSDLDRVVHILSCFKALESVKIGKMDSDYHVAKELKLMLERSLNDVNIHLLVWPVWEMSESSSESE